VLCRIIWNIITRNAITKVRTISCCFRPVWARQVREARSVVGSGSAAYSNITAAPHEYFYHTTIQPVLLTVKNYRVAAATPTSSCFLDRVEILHTEQKLANPRTNSAGLAHQ
jgi:hypothetical protein